jgi:hypothetical protein
MVADRREALTCSSNEYLDGFNWQIGTVKRNRKPSRAVAIENFSNDIATCDLNKFEKHPIALDVTTHLMPILGVHLSGRLTDLELSGAPPLATREADRCCCTRPLERLVRHHVSTVCE